MVQIAVIKKNDVSFDEIENYVMPLLYQEHSEEIRKGLKSKLIEYIWNTISPYVQLIQVESENLIETVCTIMGQDYPDKSIDSDFYFHSEPSYSFSKRHLEFIHFQPLWKDYDEQKGDCINHLVSLFSLQHKVIENTAIIITNCYDNTNNVAMVDTTIEDIVRVVRRRFYFAATIIRNENFIKYYYQNPTYLVKNYYGLDDQSKIQTIEIDFLGYRLVFYFQHDKSKYVNKAGTRINGMFQLHGDVIMTCEMSENIPSSISIHETMRLNVLAYGRLYDRQLKEDEIHREKKYQVENGAEKESTKTPLWSKHVIINKRMLKWPEKRYLCINCGGKFSKPIICNRCFRARYCSQKCQNEFRHYHDDECINPASL